MLLVLVQSAFAEAFDAGEDIITGLGPHERTRILVGLVNGGLDRDL